MVAYISPVYLKMYRIDAISRLSSCVLPRAHRADYEVWHPL